MDTCCNAPQASVIIPVYNAANTLAECLDSILSQTLADFEVICIDDGSADNSREILEAYASKDSRVRIVQQENQGPGATRNHGIRLATGAYILFVDSDDYILPATLETVCGIGFEQDADIVLFDGDKFDAVSRKRIPTRYMLRRDLLPKNLQVFSAQDCPGSIFQISSPAPYLRAYRREMVLEKELFFSDMPNSEDILFSYTAIASARGIACTPEKFYMERANQTANVESGKANAPLRFIEAYLELANWLKENELFDICRKSFGLRFCSSIIHAIKTIDSPDERNAICQRLCDDDIIRLQVLDQSNGFYGNDHEVRQVRYLMQSFKREPIAQPKVSVIIPVFNVEKYLEECLDSVLDQTMPDFEVLCVDDGSEDRSCEILTLYSRLDSRIRVIFGDHQGAAEARNMGIDSSAGEYLYFMDSDDKVVDTLLEKAYATAIHANADVVAFDVQTLNMKNGKLERPSHCFRKDKAPVGKSVFSMADVPDHIFQISNPAPWTKLVRRQFVIDKNLRYQNLNNANDAYFNFMAMALAQRITLLDEPLYIYRTGMTANTQSKKDSHPECSLEARMAVYNRLKQEQILKLCEKSWISELLANICFTIKTLSTKEAYQKIYRRLQQPDITATGYMDHEESYYLLPHHYDLVKKWLKSPIKYATMEERNSQILFASACEEPAISVIIPAYNAEDYLNECLSSIQKQTLQNIEIICVDDGSSDNTLRILCKEAKNDPRITVITQKNSGLSAARNTGIRAARGKYLYYIDSDDMLEPHALQVLLETIEENELDYIFFSAKTLFDSDEIKRTHSRFENYYHHPACSGNPMSGPDLFAVLVQEKEYWVQACMQMVSAELVRENGISFYEGIIHEDQLYTLQVILNSKRCMAVNEQFYLRRMREGSIMTSEASVGHLVGYLVSYVESLNTVNSFDLTVAQHDAVCSVQNSLINNAQRIYNAISEEERLWIPAFCTSMQKSIYKTLVQPLARKSAAVSPAPAAAQQNKRLNDHDTALHYAQEELASSRNRLNDHDVALGYLQAAVKEMQNSRSWKLGRMITWLPRKLKALLRR